MSSVTLRWDCASVTVDFKFERILSKPSACCLEYMKSHPTLFIVWHGALYPSYRKPFCLLQEDFGWSVHLLAASRWKQALPQATRFQEEKNEPIQIHCHYPWFSFHGALHIQPLFPWVFHKIKPDAVLIIEEPFSIMGWWCSYWCKRIVPPVPVLLYSYQDIQKNYPPPFSWMERFVLRHADYMFASNQEGLQVFRRKGRIYGNEVLPTSVNLERFRYKQPCVQNPIFTVGYVGRLSEEKGLEDLLWSLVDTDDRIRLRLVGDGPARYWLEVRARELGIAERIVVMPPVSHEELPGVYHDFDALVLPSRTTSSWQEQFGRVLIEAMACGVPVIGSDSGAIPEVIGEAGLIFPEGKAPQLSEKILQLYHDPHLRADLSLRGRIRVEQYFSAKSVARKLDKFLDEVTGHANSA